MYVCNIISWLWTVKTATTCETRNQIRSCPWAGEVTENFMGWEKCFRSYAEQSVYVFLKIHQVPDWYIFPAYMVTKHKMKIRTRKQKPMKSSWELAWFICVYFLIFLEIAKMLLLKNMLHKQPNSSKSKVTQSSSPLRAQRNKNRSLLRCGSPKSLNSQKEF